MHFIFPEGERALARIRDEPAHLLFRAYGEQVPAADWNEDGTKQGIYMMGPNGEYLEGAHASSGHADRLAKRLERALDRWRELSREQDYANRPVPGVRTIAPPEVAEAPLGLRVFMRDLPRGDGDDSGRRIRDEDRRGRSWMHFTEWAWNQKWLVVERPRELVTTSREPVAIDDATARRIARNAFVDNVRGQNPAWRDEDVRKLELTMRLVETRGDVATIEYEGRADLRRDGRAYAPTVFGSATWNTADEEFLSFRLVAVGTRRGAARFNQRGADREPAPMGVLVELAQLPQRDGGDGR